MKNSKENMKNSKENMKNNCVYINIFKKDKLEINK